MNLAVVVPSRGRPGSLRLLTDALNRTCTAGTDLVVGLDEDDPFRGDYPPDVRYVVRKGLRSVVPWMNELAVPLAQEYQFIGMLGDDNLPRTVGWDARIIEALGETPFAFTNDMYPREPGSHVTHLFCRSEIITALGYLGPPVFKHMFVDNAWTEWGKACGITYLHDVLIEHLHFTTGKSEYDDTYKAGVVHWDADKAAWEKYQKEDLARDIDRIKAVL